MIDQTFQKVRLLDESHRPMGLCDKAEAHEKGLHHLAFSIYIFDNAGRMLIQQRNPAKYHSGGLWTNACCSHPLDPGQVTEFAAERLQQEMGFVCPLTHLFSFGYRAEYDNGMTEDEWDMVLTGVYEGPVDPDPEEASSYRWIEADTLRQLVRENPENFTVWFRKSFETVLEYKGL